MLGLQSTELQLDGEAGDNCNQCNQRKPPAHDCKRDDSRKHRYDGSNKAAQALKNIRKKLAKLARFIIQIGRRLVVIPPEIES